MRITPMKLVLVLSCTVALIAGMSLSLVHSASPPPDITAFRSWKRVTKSPFPMDEAVSGLCRPTPRLWDMHKRVYAEHAEAFEKSVHTGRDGGPNYVHVYVNEIGKKAIPINGPKFPIGSIIVKEKFPGKWTGKWDDKQNSERLVLGSATVLTMMRKREAGYDSKNGDWEYFTGDAKTLVLTKPDPKALKACQSCHALYKDRDFITKTYMLGGLETIFIRPKK